jgi:hypothetical protein
LELELMRLKELEDHALDLNLRVRRCPQVHPADKVKRGASADRLLIRFLQLIFYSLLRQFVLCLKLSSFGFIDKVAMVAIMGLPNIWHLKLEVIEIDEG